MSKTALFQWGLPLPGGRTSPVQTRTHSNPRFPAPCLSFLQGPVSLTAVLPGSFIFKGLCGGFFNFSCYKFSCIFVDLFVVVVCLFVFCFWGGCFVLFCFCFLWVCFHGSVCQFSSCNLTDLVLPFYFSFGLFISRETINDAYFSFLCKCGLPYHGVLPAGSLCLSEPLPPHPIPTPLTPTPNSRWFF